MELDKQQDAPKEDTVCVGSQSIIRLLSEQWQHIVGAPSVDPKERDNRLAAICLEIHKIIKQARPCGHAQPVAHVTGADGKTDWLGEMFNAIRVEWERDRR